MANTTPLHKSRLQMTKKTAPGRPNVLQFSCGHSQYVPQNAICLLWARSRRVQLNEYALNAPQSTPPKAASCHVRKFRPGWRQTSCKQLLPSANVRTMFATSWRGVVESHAVPTGLPISDGNATVFEIRHFLMGPTYWCPPPSPVGSLSQTQVHWARIRTVSRHSGRHSRAVFN